MPGLGIKSAAPPGQAGPRRVPLVALGDGVRALVVAGRLPAARHALGAPACLVPARLDDADEGLFKVQEPFVVLVSGGGQFAFARFAARTKEVSRMGRTCGNANGMREIVDKLAR